MKRRGGGGNPNFRKNYNNGKPKFNKNFKRRSFNKSNSRFPKRYSPEILEYFKQLFGSDVPLVEDIDLQLRIWLGQLVDLAIDRNPTEIEARFYSLGAGGFDIIDNGTATSEEELKEICKLNPNGRYMNQEYKTISFGHRGEALHSLCKISHVSILTQGAFTSYGHLATYDEWGDIITMEKIDMQRTGTVI